MIYKVLIRECEKVRETKCVSKRNFLYLWCFLWHFFYDFLFFNWHKFQSFSFYKYKNYV